MNTNRQKRFHEMFVYAKVFAKNVCLRSRWLRWHCVSVVVDYVDIVSVYSSQWLRWHKVNYFTSEKVKKNGMLKNVIWYFQKLRVHVAGVVADYAGKCWNNRWLCWHDVSVVIDYSDKVLA